jgi:alpha-tubulin suppressor-like RCC1 family protein
VEGVCVEDPVQLTARALHRCAVLGTGPAICWGDDEFEQQGNGAGGDQLAPDYVLGVGGGTPLTGVRRIAAGNVHNCAALADTSAVCRGYNNWGQLGAGDATAVSRPRLP